MSFHFVILQLIAEVSRLKNVNIVSKMSTFMKDSRVQLILQSVSSKKVQDSVEKSTNKDPSGHLFSGSV